MSRKCKKCRGNKGFQVMGDFYPCPRCDATGEEPVEQEGEE